MDFSLNEDERAIEDVARRFATDRLAPFAAEWDETAHFPVDVLREAAALGFAGIYVKSDVGGSEMTPARCRDHHGGIVGGLHVDGGVPLDPQYGVVDDRPLTAATSSASISCPS